MEFQYKILEKVNEMLAVRGEAKCEEHECTAGRLFVNARQIIFFTFFDHAKGEGKFVTAHLKAVESALVAFGKNRAIIICRDVAPGMNETLNMDKQRFEVHSEPEKLLIGNLNKHILVPKHILLTPEEEKKLPYKREHLPKILSSDPIVQYNGWSSGVVKIEAKDGIVYRVIT